jgi:exosortase C (VPDSG-CTERM-specific)
MTIKLLKASQLGATLAVFAVLFSKPLWDLMRLCLSNDLYSYIPLIPLVSAFLIWTDRRKLPKDSVPSRGLALLPAGAALAVLGIYVLARRSGWVPDIIDHLAVMVLALLLLVLSAGLFILGKAFLGAVGFPVFYLIFAIPMPTAMRDWLESFLQHKSADVADLLFSISGMPVFRQELVFQLPGFSFQVAPECSGIHSTWVLVVLSFLAAYLFLQSGWRRAALIAAVLPLALLRNGFRIFVIGELCVHISPDMINSYIHRHGGPIFFVLSLIPFALLLAVLQKTERRRAPPGAVENIVTPVSPS